MTAYVETPDSEQNLGVYGSAKLVAIRTCRLNSDCSPMLGAQTAVATAAIVKADSQPDYYDGKEYMLVGGNGAIQLYAHDTDKIKRNKLSLELATRDFELIEMLTGATLILSASPSTAVAAGSNDVDADTFTGAGVLHVTASGTTGFLSAGTITVATSTVPAVISYTGLSGGDEFTGCTLLNTVAVGSGEFATDGAVTQTAAIGLGVRGVGLPAQNYISVEIWSLTVSDFGVCNTQAWYRTVWPHAVFALGNYTYQNDIATVMMSGFTNNNPNWGTGIDDSFPGTAWDTLAPEVTFLDTVGPPTLQPGYLDTTAPSSPSANYTAH